MKNIHLGFMASHGGSNMQAIIDACKSGTIEAIPSVVISNNSESGAIERAKNETIPYEHISNKTHPNPDDFDNAIISALEKHNVDIVVLAGYMKKISNKIIEHYRGRILNIHPALLPKYGGSGMWGIHVHDAVIAAGEKISGATIHIVDERYDHGRILAQMEVPVLDSDTPETLAARVLEAEHLLYPETLRKICRGEIEL